MEVCLIDSSYIHQSSSEFLSFEVYRQNRSLLTIVQHHKALTECMLPVRCCMAMWMVKCCRSNRHKLMCSTLHDFDDLHQEPLNVNAHILTSTGNRFIESLGSRSLHDITSQTTFHNRSRGISLWPSGHMLMLNILIAIDTWLSSFSVETNSYRNANI